MFRPFIAILCFLAPSVAWAQQTPPPPDTKAARERHRIQEKEPPPPEGPWGAEDFGLTWINPKWRGLLFDVGSYSGSSIALNVPRGVSAFSDGVNPPIFERLTWHEESFRATSFTLAADLDMVRLSTSLFNGTFDARGSVSRDNGVSQTGSDVSLHGDVYGFRVGAYWPALRYRDDLFEFSGGPMATVGWMHEEVRPIPNATMLTRGSWDALTGSLGPKLSARLFLMDRFAVEADVEYSYLAGSARGWTKQYSLGVGIHF